MENQTNQTAAPVDITETGTDNPRATDREASLEPLIRRAPAEDLLWMEAIYGDVEDLPDRTRDTVTDHTVFGDLWWPSSGGWSAEERGNATGEVGGEVLR
jgi:hypothetical protein